MDKRMFRFYGGAADKKIFEVPLDSKGKQPKSVTLFDFPGQPVYVLSEVMSMDDGIGDAYVLFVPKKRGENSTCRG